MIFITYLFVFMKYYGISANAHEKSSLLWKSFMFVLCSLPLMFVLIPGVVYLIVYHNSENVLGITDLFYTIFMFTGLWGGFTILTVRQKYLHELINELRSLVAKSEYYRSSTISPNLGAKNRSHRSKDPRDPFEYVPNPNQGGSLSMYYGLCVYYTHQRAH